VLLEAAVVVALSLGESGVYAVVRLLDLVSRGPLADAQANLNVSANERPWFDLTYQLLGIGFALVPVALALLLLSRDRLLPGGAGLPPVLARLGVAGGRATSGAGSCCSSSSVRARSPSTPRVAGWG
jgi:hypothetical protein